MSNTCILCFYFTNATRDVLYKQITHNDTFISTQSTPNEAISLPATESPFLYGNSDTHMCVYM